MRSSIEIAVEKVLQDFQIFGSDWASKYEYLIQMGERLPKMAPELKTSENLVRGCSSRVWLVAKLEKGKVIFEADSDAPIPKGIAALLVAIFNGHFPSEVVEASLGFLDKMGLRDNLSPSRSAGMLSIAQEMKRRALLFL